MIQVTNTTAQTIQPGQSVIFDKVQLKSGNCECFNTQTPRIIKLCRNGLWNITFSGNVTSDTAGTAVQLAIAVMGETLLYTVMNRTIATANNLENVSTSTGYGVRCCGVNQISVINSGTEPVTLGANSALLIERIS